MVAYQAGNAANVAPPATTSHTSLPSHTGAIVSSIALRSRSSRPTKGSRIPTPKSNPSSMKYPAQRNAITQNQSVSRPISRPPSVPHRRLGGLIGVGRARGRRRIDARIPAHEHEIGDPEEHIQRHEHGQAEPDGPRANAR